MQTFIHLRATSNRLLGPARSRRRIGAARTAIALAALLSAMACAAPADDVASGAAPQDRPPATFLRLELTRAASGGPIEVGRLTRVSTPGRPTPGGFEYFLVSYAGDELRSTVSFNFPLERTREWVDSEGRVQAGVTSPLSSATISVMTPYDETVTRLEILDGEGEVVARIDPADAEEITAAASSWLVRPAYAAEVQTIYHIEIISDIMQLEEENRVPALRSDDNPLVEELQPLTPGGRVKLKAALDRLPPTLLGSIARIGIAKYESGGAADGDLMIAGDTWGNNMIFNADFLQDQNPARLNNVIAHESAHCYHNVVDEQRDVRLGNLPPNVEIEAEAARGRLGVGTVYNTLERLQKTAQISGHPYGGYKYAGWASAYGSDGEAVRDAFASKYGSNDPRDDLAELVVISVDPAFANHGYCTQFLGLDEEVPPAQILAFAKLNFLKALGLLEPNQYDQCVRDADPMNETHEGIYARIVAAREQSLVQPRNLEFTEGLSGGLQTVRHENLRRGYIMMRVKGESPNAHLEVRLRVQAESPRLKTPVGFYELDTAGSYGLASDRLIPVAAQNVLLYQRSDVDNDTELMAHTRTSGAGFAVVTEAGDDMIAGYAFLAPLHTIVELQPLPTDVAEILWFRIPEGVSNR